MRPIRVLIALAVSAAAGFYLLTPLGLLFDWMKWPVLNTWALLNSTAIYAWAVLSLIMLAIVVRSYHWVRLHRRRNTYD